MKPQAIARTVVFAMCIGLTLVASAVDSESKLQDSAPAAPVEKPDDSAEQAAWEAKETELLKAVKEVVTAQAAARKNDTATDWAAVEANVRFEIFQQVIDKGDADWPHAQYSWVYGACKDLSRLERHEKRKFNAEQELEILNALEMQLRNEVQALKDPAVEEADKTLKAEEDETLWKFRDKSGSRTTKPRYKGQEPVN